MVVVVVVVFAVLAAEYEKDAKGVEEAFVNFACFKCGLASPCFFLEMTTWCLTMRQSLSMTVSAALNKVTLSDFSPRTLELICSVDWGEDMGEEEGVEGEEYEDNAARGSASEDVSKNQKG